MVFLIIILIISWQSFSVNSYMSRTFIFFMITLIWRIQSFYSGEKALRKLSLAVQRSVFKASDIGTILVSSQCGWKNWQQKQTRSNKVLLLLLWLLCWRIIFNASLSSSEHTQSTVARSSPSKSSLPLVGEQLLQCCDLLTPSKPRSCYHTQCTQKWQCQNTAWNCQWPQCKES